MITKWFVTGDLHGRLGLDRFKNIKEQLNSSVGIIILGDAGFNYYLNSTDHKMKMAAAEYGCYFYCVRGNHEARPEDIESMTLVWDDNVNGKIYMENEYPHIRYFQDGGIYTINGYSVLVIGGAYSVDKYYRLWRVGLTEENNNPKISGWFENEMLNMNEMANIFKLVNGQSFDVILTHTCPISIEPTDLFLDEVDQSSVDKTMERFLERIKNNVQWGVWCFGHFHRDRLERPHMEQYYTDIEDLETIINRWKNNDVPWWFVKSPHYFWE